MISLVAGSGNKERAEKTLIQNLKDYKKINGVLPRIVKIGEGVNISKDMLWLLQQTGVKIEYESKKKI